MLQLTACLAIDITNRIVFGEGCTNPDAIRHPVGQRGVVIIYENEGDSAYAHMLFENANTDACSTFIDVELIGLEAFEVREANQYDHT